MNTLHQVSDSQRRQGVRRSGLCGIDYVEVDEAQTQLTVTFFGRAPSWINAKHLRLEGGRRERGLRITNVEREPKTGVGSAERLSDNVHHDDRLIVTVDRPGDDSTYELSVVDFDEDGEVRPPRGFDPRYASVSFTFKADNRSDIDCATPVACELAVQVEPPISYLAKDYSSFRRLLLDRLSLLLPNWNERHAPDIGITLVELLAYVGDHLSYQQDAVATEAYLGTARLRTSVRRHARLVDYLLHEGCNARAWAVFEIKGGKQAVAEERTSHDQDAKVALRREDFYIITQHPQLVGPTLKHEDFMKSNSSSVVGFQALVATGDESITFRQDRNRISFYAWGQADCCLEEGARSATLLDPGKALSESDHELASVEASNGRWHRLGLKPGDVLVFEELVGPRTGANEDADPKHRHAVRLTEAVCCWDPLTKLLVWEIAWSEEDALPFPLCVATVSDACVHLQDVSIAWGNVLMVDQGLDVESNGSTECDLGIVSSTSAPSRRCADACYDDEVSLVPDRFRPKVPKPDVTYAEPLAAADCNGAGYPECGTLSATAALRQDVLKALPQATLTSRSKEVKCSWTPRLDLLSSADDDCHFVVEVDDERVAWLRLGDGDCGRQPEAGEAFHARYRVGNGVRGNVGAETLTQIVFRREIDTDLTIDVRNPMPAVGGTAPEPVSEARLRAPQVFRRRIERAVKAEDYATIVMRDFPAQVQRAAAELRSSGAAIEIQVVVDVRGTAEAKPDLLRCIEAHLQRFRRIGHDVRVLPAVQVPLNIAMTIRVKPGYLKGHVKTALLEVFGVGSRGFFNPDALLLGEAIRMSRLVATAQAVEGIAGVVVKRFERLYAGPKGEIDDGLLLIRPVEVARMDNDPGRPQNGRLTLVMEGGR